MAKRRVIKDKQHNGQKKSNQRRTNSTMAKRRVIKDQRRVIKEGQTAPWPKEE